MPCELVNNKFKEITRENFNKLQKSRQKMNRFLFSQPNCRKFRPRQNCVFVKDNERFIAKDGGRTKY
jgi:hypothetical protein